MCDRSLHLPTTRLRRLSCWDSVAAATTIGAVARPGQGGGRSSFLLSDFLRGSNGGEVTIMEERLVASIVPRLSSGACRNVPAKGALVREGLRNRNCMGKGEVKDREGDGIGESAGEPTCTGGQGDIGDAVKKIRGGVVLQDDLLSKMCRSGEFLRTYIPGSGDLCDCHPSNGVSSLLLGDSSACWNSDLGSACV
jgi:hypothetical protein